MCRVAHEREVRNMSAQLVDLERQREAAAREGEEIKTQLKMVEDVRDNIRTDLVGATQKLRELEEVSLAYRLATL